MQTADISLAVACRFDPDVHDFVGYGYCLDVLRNTLGNWSGNLFGGYSGTLEVHRITGLVLLVGLAAPTLCLLYCIDWKRSPGSLLGSDSLVFPMD